VVVALMVYTTRQLLAMGATQPSDLLPQRVVVRVVVKTNQVMQTKMAQRVVREVAEQTQRMVRVQAARGLQAKETLVVAAVGVQVGQGVVGAAQAPLVQTTQAL